MTDETKGGDHVSDERCEFVSDGGYECPSIAEWSIVDKADFDPVSCTTLACDVHLSSLVGHAAGVPAGVTEVWEVRSLHGIEARGVEGTHAV